MNSYRKTLVLVALFFASLLTLLGMEWAGVYTINERALRESRVLPALISVPEGQIDRVEIDRGKERLVFERRGLSWQLVEPIDAAAEPNRLENLVRSLKELRRSPDSGTYRGERASFGLAPAAATVRLWARSSGEGVPRESTPLATLAIGKIAGQSRYVTADGGDIEIVDSRYLNAVDSPLVDWRDPIVMNLPTFLVSAVKIERDGKTIRAERMPRGQWRLVEPAVAPANSAKVESLLAALNALRAVDGSKGFAADNVRDFAPYGLASPAVTIEVKSNRPELKPRVVHVGARVPGQSDRFYVRQGDQDDVVIVDGRGISEIPTTAKVLRSPLVCEFEPALASRIEFKTRTDSVALQKSAMGWELVEPEKELADRALVETFLAKLRALETSEFFEPGKIGEPALDPPLVTIKLWQSKPGEREPASAARAQEPPTVSLQFGRHDVLRKTLFARVEHDDLILAIPDVFLEAMPKQPFPFRVLTLGTDRPDSIKRLTITAGGRVDELEPDPTGEPNHWKMRKPVDGPADHQAVTEALLAIAGLRAEAFVSATKGDGAAYGLDRPIVEVAWQTDKTRMLRIGSPARGKSTFHAALDDRPFVFTLSSEVVDRFRAEFHDRRVLTFAADRAARATLRWPTRTVVLKRRLGVSPGQAEWVDEPGSDIRGLDLSRIAPLVSEMSHLRASRFFQYDGPIPDFTGLSQPRLAIEVECGPPEAPRVLRIGTLRYDEHVYAAVGTDDHGPVFFLPAGAWDALVKSGTRLDALPDNVFAPAR